MQGREILALAIVATVLALPLVGCSKVTKANFDKVSAGMTEEEVTKALGEPEEKSTAGGAVGGLAGSAGTWKWESGDKVITVVFANGKVVSKTQSNLE